MKFSKRDLFFEYPFYELWIIYLSLLYMALGLSVFFLLKNMYKYIINTILYIFFDYVPTPFKYKLKHLFSLSSRFILKEYKIVWQSIIKYVSDEDVT